ncbi:multiple sugar transport system substrate-binding protein [Paenibacillus sp. UNCCL117]|uniref:ABC transporter substrate-binding protein n=1 Tax=unclassified Paenibacillus TaxID=185978 RepID=UPI000880E7F5|nr:MULTISPECIES: sugar ABC transporter substrate-binding protein [unclassified Paenibacillus]SDD69041.1 carbohydrate ABC transporter substrate-binding protein, CUT1 family [Paenibacillus sp. cl123]SFW45058.1 multiple sugar transport system substrate-binding protein [Paenibacillus sp. UNCCL117]
MKGYGQARRGRWRAALSIVLCTGLLSGCLPTAKNSTAPAEQGKAGDGKQVELRFAWWGSQGRHDRTLKVIQKFEELHPGIKIKPEYTSFDGYWEKLATQVAARNEPDLMQMSILYIKEYSERGVLLDLSPYAGKDVQVADLNQDVLRNQGTIGGKLTGLPVSDNASVLIYNKEMYRQAGIEPPSVDLTWDEYFEKAKQIRSKLGDKVYGAFDMSSSLEAFMYYLFSVEDTMYSGNRLGYKDENFKAWLTMWDKARTEGVIPPASTMASFMPIGNADPNKDALMTGMVPIMGPQFTATFPAYENVMKDKIDMVAYPRAKRTGSALLPAMFMSASAQSKHPKEAAMFLDFFLNAKEAADILEMDRGLPENKKILEYLAPKFTERDKKMVRMLEHVTSIQPPMYDGGPKGAGEVTKLFEQLVQKQQFGKATIDETVATFRKEADKVFAKNNS